MSEKKNKYIVVHPKLYLKKEGETGLSHVPKDSEIKLTVKEAERLGDKVKEVGKKTVLNVGFVSDGSDSDEPDSGGSDGGDKA